MLQAFFENKFVQFELGDDLLQSVVLFLQALHLRELLPAHAANRIYPRCTQPVFWKTKDQMPAVVSGKT